MARKLGCGMDTLEGMWHVGDSGTLGSKSASDDSEVWAAATRTTRPSFSPYRHLDRAVPQPFLPNI